MLKDIWTKYNKIIIGGAIILIIIFGSSVFTLFRRPIKLTVWGSNLSSEEFDLLTASIKPKSGNVIKFEYTEIESEKYEKTILESFINSESPDIFLITDDQIGKFKKLISPLSLEDKNYNLANLKKDYPTIIVDNAVIDNNLYVSPITIDSLAMYYNRNIFDSLSIANPPKTWNELLALIPDMRQLDTYNRIVRAPVAMGLGDDINNSADMLALLIMQFNGQIVDAENQKSSLLIRTKFNNKYILAGEEALKFYTQFSQSNNQYYSWNQSFGNDLTAFANNKLAIYFGYKSDKDQIEKKNANLNFDVAEMPQILSNNSVNFGKFMGLTVSSQSKNAMVAWEAIKLMTEAKNIKSLIDESKLPPANRQLISEYLSDPDIGIFAKQSLNSKTYFHPDTTLTKNAFVLAIDSIRYNQDYENAIRVLHQSLTNIFYNN